MNQEDLEHHLSCHTQDIELGIWISFETILKLEFIIHQKLITKGSEGVFITHSPLKIHPSQPPRENKAENKLKTNYIHLLKLISRDHLSTRHLMRLLIAKLRCQVTKHPSTTILDTNLASGVSCIPRVEVEAS